MKSVLLYLITTLCFLNTSIGQSKTELDSLYALTAYVKPLEAVEWQKKLQAIHEKASDWNKYITSSYEIAVNYYQAGDLENVLVALDEGMKVSNAYQLPKKSPIQSYILNLYGIVASLKGNTDAAISYYEQSLAIDTTLPNISNSDIIYSYNNIAAAYDDIGDYEHAISYYKKAIFIEEQEQKNPDILTKINLFNNIGFSYFHINEHKQASHYYQQALSLLSKCDKRDKKYSSVFKATYTNLATELQATGQLDKSLFYLQKMLDLPHLTNNDRSTAYKFIGTTFYKQQAYDIALDTLKKCLELRKLEYPKKHYVLSRTYFALGDLYSAKNQEKLALENYHYAVQSVVLDFSDNRISELPQLDKVLNSVELLKALSAKANIFLKEKEYQLALAHYEKALELIDKMRVSYANQKSKFFLMEQGSNIYEKAIESAIQLGNKSLAYEFSEKSKGMLLLEATRGLQARFNLPESLVRKEQEIQTNIDYYNRIIWNEKQKEKIDEDRVRNWENLIFKLEEEYSGLKEEIALKYPEYFDYQYDSKVTTVRDVQKQLLNKNSAVISYFVGKEHIYVFGLTKNRLEVSSVSQDNNLKKSINQLLYFLRKEIDAATTYYQEGYSIYNKLLEPTIRDLPSTINRLIIVPDGQLNYLPFEALLTKLPETKEARFELNQIPYLIKNYQISYGYSTTLLIEGLKKRQVEGLQPFAGFAPIFDAPVATQRGCEGTNLGELIYGKENISKINAVMQGHLFLDQEANTQKFRTVAEQYKILHLCTHACAAENFEEARIYFSDEELLAFELSNISLNAELVVLSACETGIGELKKGEGVMSLSRAFMYAGCPSVLTSLWSIDDKSTSELMLHFYENIKMGYEQSKALHLAKLKYLENKGIKYAHPYYWSGFVHIGNEKALYNVDFSYWMLLGGLIILIVVSWLIRRYILA